MLLLAAAFVLSATIASASDDPGGGGLSLDKRADGYAMAWRKGKRFSPAATADAASPLYGARYVLAAPRQPIRELDVTQPYGAYDLDSSLYIDDDNDDTAGSIAAFPAEGAFDKRGAAYSQWRKNGKRAQQIFKDYASSKRAYRDWRKGKRSGSGFKQWRKMG